MANAILGIFHLHAQYPQAPITNYVAMQLLVFVLLVVSFAIVRARLSVDNPGPLQHMMEGIDSFVGKQGHEVIGHGYEQYTGYLTILGIFILVCCLIGVIPGFESPTAVPSVPLGCALVTWFYYHYHGIRKNGFGYVKNFLGPEPLLPRFCFPSKYSAIWLASCRSPSVCSPTCLPATW